MDAAIAALRYGSVCVNSPSIMGFCLTKTTWGAFSGGTPQVRLQSWHNARGMWGIDYVLVGICLAAHRLQQDLTLALISICMDSRLAWAVLQPVLLASDIHVTSLFNQALLSVQSLKQSCSQ